MRSRTLRTAGDIYDIDVIISSPRIVASKHRHACAMHALQERMHMVGHAVSRHDMKSHDPANAIFRRQAARAVQTQSSTIARGPEAATQACPCTAETEAAVQLPQLPQSSEDIAAIPDHANVLQKSTSVWIRTTQWVHPLRGPHDSNTTKAAPHNLRQQLLVVVYSTASLGDSNTPHTQSHLHTTRKPKQAYSEAGKKQARSSRPEHRVPTCHVPTCHVIIAS